VQLGLFFPMRLEIFASGRDDPCWSPPSLGSRRSEHSTPGPLLCETVHAARTNDQTSLQAKFPSLPNHLLAVQTAEPQPLALLDYCTITAAIGDGPDNSGHCQRDQRQRS